jgi:hypothetical protein
VHIIAHNIRLAIRLGLGLVVDRRDVCGFLGIGFGYWGRQRRFGF